MSALGETRSTAVLRADEPVHVGHAWLAALLPADATRFAVTDEDLSSTLRGAGAELVDRDADVEIGSEDELDGTAPYALVPVSMRPVGSSPQATRAQRLLESARVRRRAAAAGRRLRRRGYESVSVVPWDLEQFVRTPGFRAPGRLAAADYFPRHAVVMAGRRGEPETVLERSRRQAAIAAGLPLDREPALLRAGGLVVVGPHAVLRLALGPGERQIGAQERALSALSSANAGAAVRRRTPELLATGRTGLGRWTVEQRLPGRPSPHELPAEVLEDCLDFAIELHRLGGGTPVATLAARAKVVAHAFEEDDAEALIARAGEADAALARLPRGFGHGDFCTSNLLEDGDRLSGVVDWDAGGAAHLPLLDIFHLRLLAETRAHAYGWGRAVVSYLVPLVRQGGDAITGRYCRELGLELSPGELQQLALAYWLQRTAYQLEMYIDRARDEVWLQRNVRDVWKELAKEEPA